MKRLLKVVFVIVSISLCVFMPKQVYAGEINAAEQSLISYCSGVFSYNGKSYQATSGAIGSMRAELAGRELSSAEANVLMNKFSANIGEAISQGYMVEVGGGQSEEQQNAEDENSTDDSKGQEDSENSEDTKDAEEKPPKNNKDQTNKNNTSPKTSKSTDKEVKNSQNEGDTPDESIVNIVSEAKNNKDDGYVISGSTAGGDNQTIDVDSNETIDQLLKNPDIYTVEAYQDGTVLVTTKDGTVLYKGEMPIKSTGLYISPGLKVTVIAAITLLTFTIGAAIMMIKNSKKAGHQNEREK